MAGLLVISPLAAHSSDINSVQISGHGAVVISGDMILGDDDRFKEALQKSDIRLVLLDSAGGVLPVGLEIGRVIRARGLATAVQSSAHCYGACVVAWLGGVDRTQAQGAVVGLHAFSRSALESDAANEDARQVIASYFKMLDISAKAVTELGAATANDVTPLTPDIAQQLGLAMRIVDDATLAIEPDAPAADQPDADVGPLSLPGAATAVTAPPMSSVYLVALTTADLPTAKKEAIRYRRAYPDSSVRMLPDGSYVVALSKVSSTAAGAMIDRAVKAGRVPPDSKMVAVELAGQEVFRP